MSRNFLERSGNAWRETRREKRNRDESRGGWARSNPGFFQPRMSSLPKRGVLVAMVTPYGEGEAAISVASREGDARYRWRGRRGPGSPRHRRTFCHVFVSNETKRLLHAPSSTPFVLLSLWLGEEGSTRSKDFSNRGVFGLRSEDSKKRFDSMESLLVSHALFRRGGFLVGRERERELFGLARVICRIARN